MRLIFHTPRSRNQASAAVTAARRIRASETPDQPRGSIERLYVRHGQPSPKRQCALQKVQPAPLTSRPRAQIECLCTDNSRGGSLRRPSRCLRCFPHPYPGLGGRPASRQDLAGVHDVCGIEEVFKIAHHLQFNRRLDLRHVMFFQASDAVLGADRATKFHHHIENHRVHFIPPLKILCLVHARGLRNIEMQIAVAHVAEGHDPRLRHVSPPPPASPRQ